MDLTEKILPASVKERTILFYLPVAGHLKILNTHPDRRKKAENRTHLKKVDKRSPFWRANPPPILADPGHLVRRRRIETTSNFYRRSPVKLRLILQSAANRYGFPGQFALDRLCWQFAQPGSTISGHHRTGPATRHCALP